MQKLRYVGPDSGEMKVASFSHIKEIYENEKDLTVKPTNLDFTTIYPTNFDKQKVRLTMNVFNEKSYRNWRIMAVLKLHASCNLLAGRYTF